MEVEEKRDLKRKGLLIMTDQSGISLYTIGFLKEGSRAWSWWAPCSSKETA